MESFFVVVLVTLLVAGSGAVALAIRKVSEATDLGSIGEDE